MILLKLNGDKVVEYVNGELDMEEVKRFDIDLNERNLVLQEKIAANKFWVLSN